MSRDPSVRRWATGALVALALVAGGCGSGAVDGPDEDADGASDEAGADDGGGGDGGDGGGSNQGEGENGDGGENGGENGEGDRYSWSLPIGDITPDDPHILYMALRQGCDAGAEEVDSDQYRNLTGEQQKVYDAAIAVCRGDVESGRRLFAGAGHGGSRSMCFIYAGVVSVLDQRPPDTSGCPPNPGGTNPSTESEESTTSTDSTTTTEGETTTTTGGAETTTTEAAGGGDGGG